MTEMMMHSLLCPVLIGRMDEVTILHELVEQTKGERGQVALLDGEAGVGKSRLVSEVKSYAAGQDFLLLQGNCFQTDRVFPYAPFVDLLRAYLTPPSSTADQDDVAGLVQELSRLLPDLLLADPAQIAQPAVASTDPQQEKRQLFALLLQLLTRLAKSRPLLFVIEDLHWSDESSLELLLHLVRRSTQYTMLYVLTYRSDEVSPELLHFLAELDREHLARDFSLRRLTRVEVDAMLQAIFAQHAALHTGLLESIYMLTDGNPFFVEEMLKSLVASGELVSKNGVWERALLLGTHRQRPPIPRSVQDAVHQRARHLTAEAHRLLALAAVAGRRFDFSILLAILQMGEEQMLRLIRELLEAQFVVEESAERFSFRHALTRQAIYSGLLLRERKELHRAIGETIERLHPSAFTQEGLLVDLAYHFFEGEVWPKAFDYSLRAAQRSVALYAPRAAVEHFTRALQAQAHLKEMPEAELQRARGQAYETLGEFECAFSDYEQALTLARDSGDSIMEWQSLIDIGFLWAGRDYEQSGRWLRQALDLVQQLGNRRLQAQSLNRLGNWLVNTGQTERGLEAHHEALAIFEQLQDQSGVAETLDLLGMASGIYGDTVSAVEHSQRAVELFRARQDRLHLTLSLNAYIAYAGPSWAETTPGVFDSVENCERIAAEALQLARQTDSLHAQAYVEWMIGGNLACYGEFGAARQHAQESLRIASEIGHTQWIAGAYFTLGRLYLLMLEASLAMETFKQGLTVAGEMGSAWWTGNLSAYFAQACILKGALPRAEAALKSVIARDQIPHNSPERRLIWSWGELALANDQPDAALEIVDRLYSSMPGIQRDQPIPWLLRLKARALITSGRIQEACEELERAKSGALVRHERSLLWQIHALLGQTHSYLKRDKQARQEFAAASHIIHACKATITDDYLREHFTRNALKTLPRDLAVSSISGGEQFHGLTEREYTVATLVAEGKSNREIAQILVLGERTIETHVSNILAKLDFTSRKQIASWHLQFDDKG